MKSFEELDCTPLQVEPGAPFLCVDEKGLKEIQLDAMKEGMRRAAFKTSLWMTKNRVHPSVDNECLNESAKVAAHSVLQQSAISLLEAAENLTVKDL